MPFVLSAWVGFEKRRRDEGFKDEHASEVDTEWVGIMSWIYAGTFVKTKIKLKSKDGVMVHTR